MNLKEHCEPPATDIVQGYISGINFKLNEDCCDDCPSNIFPAYETKCLKTANSMGEMDIGFSEQLYK